MMYFLIWLFPLKGSFHWIWKLRLFTLLVFSPFGASGSSEMNATIFHCLPSEYFCQHFSMFWCTEKKGKNMKINVYILRLLTCFLTLLHTELESISFQVLLFFSFSLSCFHEYSVKKTERRKNQMKNVIMKMFNLFHWEEKYINLSKKKSFLFRSWISFRVCSSWQSIPFSSQH